jgi:hypothetical protein
MKTLFKKNKAQNATNYKSARAFAIDDVPKNNGIDQLLFQRIGKSRQEIFDLMKILRTF